MRRENLTLGLSVVCAVAGTVGMLFTASIALGLNRKLTRYLELKGIYTPDYGDSRK